MRGAVGLFALAGCQLVFPLETPPPPACFENNARYLVSNTPTTWGVASSACIALDANPEDATFSHLAVLSDGAEATAIALPTDAWIGLHNVSGEWLWVTDEFPDDSNAPWQGGKPTNAIGLCANLAASNFQLDDAGCEMLKASICECDEFQP